jgi:hypothetical protein
LLGVGVGVGVSVSVSGSESLLREASLDACAAAHVLPRRVVGGCGRSLLALVG